jgi:hypothetical protein
MSVIIGIMSLVFGSYIAQPEWFDNGPYELEQVYENLEECQIASHGTGDICVGEQPSSRYMKSNVESVTTTSKLNFVQCDHWAGCYIQE